MTEPKKGLSAEQVVKSREKNGKNVISTARKASFFKSFISNLSDPIIRVLIIAMTLSVIFKFPNVNWIETGGIALSVIIATLVSTISEYSSSGAFERLKAESENVISCVRRSSAVCEIPAEELVVGDIVILTSGERVSADMCLLNGEIRVDESALTGESKEIKKSAESGKSTVFHGLQASRQAHAD